MRRAKPTQRPRKPPIELCVIARNSVKRKWFSGAGAKREAIEHAKDCLNDCYTNRPDRLDELLVVRVLARVRLANREVEYVVEDP